MLQIKKVIVLYVMLSSNLFAEDLNKAYEVWEKQTYAYLECVSRAKMKYIEERMVSCFNNTEQQCNTENIVEITMEAENYSSNIKECEEIKPPNDLRKIKIE